ncbi:MAG TPA: GNAT family N-acetyltransferase [Actinomycetota bacterium]|nr:GNAT family N-acetyltransferase [Actinomycetota bacterium]
METDRADLERAIAFEDWVGDQLIDKRVPFPGGLGLFATKFPVIWDANKLLVQEASGMTAEDLAAEAERLHSAEGHEHRAISMSDPDLSMTYGDEFAELGWKVDRFVVMAHRGDPPPLSGDTEVHELTAEAMRDVRSKVIGEQPYGQKPEVVAQLLDIDVVLRDAIAIRFFGASTGGTIGSICELYSDGKTAQIEDVATLKEHRKKGLARALLAQVLDLVYREEHDFVFLVADEEDWPKDFYAGMGFVPIGRYQRFLRPGGVDFVSE